MTNETLCWCGEKELEPFSPRYGRCPRCETLVLLDRPPERDLQVEEEERDFYGHRYFEHLTQCYGYPDLATRARVDLRERCLHWLRTVLQYRHPPADILELGSAHGAFVGLLRWAGFDATGLELSQTTAEFAAAEFGAPTRVGPLDRQDFAPGSTDVIVLMDVLEHLPNPAATIRRCRSLLRTDGFLVIQTPRVPSGKTYAELVADRDPFLDQMKEKEHLYLFSEHGVADFLGRLDCAHVTFEPAIFAHYDMFLVASPAPLKVQGDWQPSAQTPHPPEARLVRALLDTDDALRASQQQTHAGAEKLAASEADRAARLELIHAQGAQIRALEAERNQLRKQLDRFHRPWTLARAVMDRVRGHRAEPPQSSAGIASRPSPAAISGEAVSLATAMASRAHDRSLFPLWEAHGFHVTPVHFYSPIPNVAAMPESLWQRPSELVGIDLNEAGQLTFLRETCASFKTEYDAFPHQPTGAVDEYYFDQPMFRSVDAEVLHCIVRNFRPKRLVEVGSGFSTLVSAAALLKNAAEGHPGAMIAIEPYPSEVFSKGTPGGCELRRQRVQDVDLTVFESLSENDILFVDSSHVLRVDSDVRHLFLEVIPRLRPGVVVHVHDIFLPAHYPRQWVVEEQRFWTEQYLLQAFLAFNESFEIMWAGSYMRTRHAERLREAFASYDSSVWPGSFWFRRLTGTR